MKKNYSTLIYLAIFGIVFYFIITPKKTSTDNSTSNSNSTSSETTTNSEPERKECSYCKGTGIFTCTMCDGTGKNNMGNDCGCVTYVANCITMGRKPQRTALRWTCEYCDGTGYKK